ncbi:MAG: tetratricopeptide repeat protein, partial [Deltaproteobacteria bacterium]|nr:tetratricopeptide repeat protein [Deltaproteobacteria bacterium]
AGGDGLMSFSDDAGGDGLMSFSDDAGGDGLVSFSDGDEDGLVSFSDGDAEGLVSFADGDASEGPDSLAEDRLVSFPAEEEPLFDEGELESLAGDGLVDLEDEDVAPPTEEVETRAAPSPRLFTEGELAYGEDPLLSGPPAVHAQVVDAADGPHLFDQGELIQLNAAVVSDEDPASGPFKEPDFFRHLEQSAAQDERPVVEFDEEDDEEELAFDDNEDLSFSDDEADPALSEPVDPLAALSSLVSDLKPEPTPGRASVRPRLPPRPEPGLGDSDLRAGPRAVAAVPAGGGVSYGTVPTIRDFDQSTPKPAAAAIQLNADQSGGVILGMEEEILELGDASDFDEEYDEDDSSSGFRLELEEYEEDDDFEEEEEEDEEQRSAVPAVVVPAVQQLSSTEVAKRLAKAIEARDSGEMDRSIDLYSDVLDAEPDNTEAHLGRGRVYLDMGDYSRAMSDFTVAEELEPESADPRVGMGDFFFARKEYRKAIEFFDEALQISPDHAMALCRRGISYYYRRDYHAAVADLTKAMKLNPDIPNISTYLSTAKRKQKK